jgi:Domain of unknown function (DUF5666)
MKFAFPKCLISMLSFCSLLASCGGGGGSLTAGGGIDGTGIMSAGVVSAFGSIVVSGREFDTTRAAIIINGEQVGLGDDAALENLDIGKVVSVKGRISRDGIMATADRVVYSDNVIGPVETVSVIDATTKEIVVLGQTVIVNFITTFKNTTFDTLAPGEEVEVSGYIDDNRAVRATFLEKKDASALEYEVTGLVDNLNDNLKTFMINSLKVNYPSIADTLPAGIPADGLYVEVTGTIDAGSGEMHATKIQLEDELDVEEGEQFEITGFVTHLVSAFEFTVGNQVVRTDANTLFVDGASDDLALGAKLEVEGSLVDGIFLADEVEFWKPDQIEVEGLVNNIASANEFTVGIQEVRTVAGTTVFEPEDLEIKEGVRLEVKGVPIDIEHSILVADKVSLETD